MIGLNAKLRAYEEEGKKIRVAIVGSGLMGKGLVSQLSLVDGMIPSILVDRTPSKAKEAYLMAGIKEDDIVISNKVSEVNKFLEMGKYVISQDISIPGKAGLINVVVDATGNPEAGCEIALTSIENMKDIVMLNVEADSVVGPILYKKAREKGLVYTGTAGDEPGSVREIYDFAKLTGFEVLAIGKGKNNEIDHWANPDSVRERAEESSLKPSMLAGFVDGTNTMIEMNVMANSMGFVPDLRGGHGPKAEVSDLARVFSLKSQGGILNSYGVVDYVNGIAPGVFAVVTTSLDQVHRQMEFLKMGKGPNYTLYRPYHLTSLETPVSIARAVIDRLATIAPEKGQVCDTIAIAKKDLKPGDYLDGIGGFSFYGSLDKASRVKEEDLLPVGLINNKTRVLVDIKKGDLIKGSMVKLDQESLIYKLREEQKELD